MSLYKRGDVWHYDFTVKGRRYRGSTNLRSKTAARQAEDRERERAALGAPARAELTLEEAAGIWFVAKAAGKKSEKTTAIRLEIALRLLGPDTMVSRIDAPEIADAMGRRRLEKTRQGKLPTNSTVNRDLIDTTTRPILNYARKVLKQPVCDIDWSELKLAEPPGRDRTYSDAEIAAWRAALPHWHHVLFDFYGRYGPRLRELFAPLDRIDVELGAIVLRDRKNQRQHVIRLLPEDHRTVAALYSRAKEASLPSLWFKERKSGKLVPIQWRGFQSASRRALNDAKIADAKPVHDLRHHAGTMMVRKTGNLAVTKRLLGHSNIQSTMRYVHASDEDVLDALRQAYQPAPAPKRRKNTP